MSEFPPQADTVPVQDPATSLSRRAARRILQRTFVLMGKDRVLKQHIREAQTTTLWIIEDWELEWSVYFNRGKFELERRPAKHPAVTLTWTTAEGFFRQVDYSRNANFEVHIDPEQERRHFEPLLRGFFATLRGILANPIDALGESLL